MADIALIVTSAIFGILVLIGSVYFLVYFQHPEDKWVAWFPKFIIVLGLSVACFNVLLLPLDVANRDGEGGVPVSTLNVIFYLTTIIMVLFVIPFTVFYYEGSDAKDGKSNIGNQIFNAFKWCLPLLFVVLVVLIPCYMYLGYAEVKTSFLSSELKETSVIAQSIEFCTNQSCRKETLVEEIKVSFVVYTIALTSFVGWALFSVFGGVGLFSLPIDIFLEFKHRPKPISKAEYVEKKMVIGEVASALMKDAENLQGTSKALGSTKSSRFSRKAANHRNRETQFKRDVYLLEQSYQRLEEAYRRVGQNPVVLIFKLLVGIIGIVLSSLWLIHICAYFIPLYSGATPLTFLSDIFNSTSSIQLIGPLLFAMFAFWLLLCVIKGAIKMGMRVVFITIHPMKIGDTMMSSLVFNVGLILICSLPVVQFCTLSFPTYARDTEVAGIFQTQVQNLKNLNVGYSVFIFIFLAITVFSMIWLRIQRHDNKTAKKLRI